MEVSLVWKQILGSKLQTCHNNVFASSLVFIAPTFEMRVLQKNLGLNKDICTIYLNNGMLPKIRNGKMIFF